MNTYEILQTISQIAIALVGFSGIVAVLGHRSQGKWKDAEIVQLRTLVEPGIIVLFASFLPAVLQMAISSEEVSWRVSNGLLASGQLANVVSFLIRTKKTGTTRFHQYLVVVTFIAMGAHFLTAFGFISKYELVYILGLMLGLVVSTYNFLLLLFSAKESL